MTFGLPMYEKFLYTGDVPVALRTGNDSPPYFQDHACAPPLARGLMVLDRSFLIVYTEDVLMKGVDMSVIVDGTLPLETLGAIYFAFELFTNKVNPFPFPDAERAERFLIDARSIQSEFSEILGRDPLPDYGIVSLTKDELELTRMICRYALELTTDGLGKPNVVLFGSALDRAVKELDRGLSVISGVKVPDSLWVRRFSVAL